MTVIFADLPHCKIITLTYHHWQLTQHSSWFSVFSKSLQHTTKTIQCDKIKCHYRNVLNKFSDKKAIGNVCQIYGMSHVIQDRSIVVHTVYVIVQYVVQK